MHLGPILVNGKVKAGKNISIHINTSIVAGGPDNGAPVLEDGIVIGVGAVVLGPIKIAKNIAIGANAVVNKTFLEENIAIAGVPAKKISDNGRVAWSKNQKK
ncbi:serine O-acetyltransferase [Globicatella sulfidifaciens]|uniref:Serine O-acetyltransferase n=1 Tax=Globicatella sulfidifaciens DSM 15739 TaxID=1121925 RepID=A0A1T4NQW8_9LACT|nr:serine O-acetyltransferase [Globicatella sulfidifaciens]SJZ81613.1 serine O-acetyltransferase [Globicatella sulfidifaciens DSM 15739]